MHRSDQDLAQERQHASGYLNLFDIVVIGAGPAGSSAATEAARRGLSTLIIDKEVFPRDKPCGGAISGRGMSYLHEPIPAELIQREIHEARIGFRSVTRTVHRNDIIAVVVERAAFDHHLLRGAEAAGARAKLGERVQQLTDKGPHVEVETSRGTYRARVAVVAEGAFGGLKTRVREKDRPDEMGLCAVADVPAAAEEIEGFPGSTLEMQLGVAGYGYGWVFPHDDHFSVGVGDMARLMTAPRDRLADFLAAEGFDPGLAAAARLHPLPGGGIRRRIARGRILLAGDAAGFVDSFLGEGISFAVSSGRHAATAAAHAVGADGDSSPQAIGRHYERLCRKDFGRHLSRSLFVTKALHAAPDAFLVQVLRDRPLSEAFFAIPTGQTTYDRYILRTALALPRLLARLAINRARPRSTSP